MRHTTTVDAISKPDLEELLEKQARVTARDRVSKGIYEKAGQKLSTVVAVRAERPDRSKWMQLVGDQVRQCGIDLQFNEIEQYYSRG